jgi:hypothetical protein
MDHGLGFFQGVKVRDVALLVEHLAYYGIDHLVHQSVGRAATIQFIQNGLAFADQGEIIIEDAGDQLQRIVGQMLLGVVHRPKAGRTAILVEDQ